jgi:hypothetical protein
MGVTVAGKAIDVEGAAAVAGGSTVSDGADDPVRLILGKGVDGWQAVSPNQLQDLYILSYLVIEILSIRLAYLLEHPGKAPG